MTEKYNKGDYATISKQNNNCKDHPKMLKLDSVFFSILATICYFQQ